MYERELNVALLAARRAGRVAADMAGEDLREHDTTAEKDGGAVDLVTKGDLRAQRAIVETIRDHFSDDYIYAEEDVGDLGDPGQSRQWIVDPIDGTMNFSTGFPLYNTSVAFQDGDETVVGVVLSPRSSLGQLWYAVRGEGADTTALDGEPHPVGTSDHDKVEGSMVETFYFEPFVGHSVNHRRVASAALAFCLVADGRVDAYVTPYPLDEWDEAAGRLILQEADGRITDRSDEAPMVASNGTDLHESILELVGHPDD